MADARVTMLDIMRANMADAEVGLIDEVIGKYPEFNLLPEAKQIDGLTYQARVRTALPGTPGFRGYNEGVEISTAQRVLREFKCFLLDGSWNVDKAIAMSASAGRDSVLAEEEQDHLEKMISVACSQFYYGDPDADDTDKGFPGLQSQVDSAMSVGAGGSTAKTSVYAIATGRKNVRWIFGDGGKFDVGEVFETQVTVSSKTMSAFGQNILGRVGLQIGHKYAVGRISALGTDTGKGLTDDLLSQLFEKFETNYGMRPDMLFSHARSIRQLQRSRTATNPDGTPAPMPTEFEGVPLHLTTSLSIAE